MKFDRFESSCWLYSDVESLKNHFLVDNSRNFGNDSYVSFFNLGLNKITSRTLVKDFPVVSEEMQNLEFNFMASSGTL